MVEPKPELGPAAIEPAARDVPANSSVGRWLSLAIVAAAAMVGWLLIALLDGSGSGELIGGILLGTVFGQVTLAAAWTALGPCSLICRLPLALAWIAAISIAVAFNIIGDNGNFEEIVVISGAILAQWLLVQGPLWLLAFSHRIRIRHRGDSIAPAAGANVQFGIRQLMILTAIVAIALGTGRMLLGSLKLQVGGNDWWEGCLLFGFIVLTNCVLTLPLLGAALLPRYTVLSIIGALVFAVLATLLEVPLLNRIVQGPPSDNYVVFVILNLVQCTWVLATVATLRWGGYGINSPRSEKDASLAKAM